MSTRLALAALVLIPVVAGAWQTPLPGTPGASRPFGIALDGGGDVLVAGRVAAADTNDDALLSKVAGPDGAVLWQKTFAGSAGGSDLLRAVVADATHAVVAVGQVQSTGTGSDLLAVRYGSDGTETWRKDLDGGAAGEDDGSAVTVDVDGAALIAGQTTPAGITGTRFAVWKLAAADGATAWRTTVGDSAGIARAIVRDGGVVYAAGDGSGKIVVAKVATGDGTTAWHREFVGSADGSHVGRVLAVGGGRVVVAGRVTSATRGQDFAVIALDPANGDEAWRYTLDGSATGTADTDDAFDVAVDPSGDVIAAGRVGNTGTGDDGVVVKLDGETGAEQWRVSFDGTSHGADIAQAIALDGDDVLVTGGIRNLRASSDVLLARLAGATGAVTWRLALNGTASNADAGFAIAALSGDLVAATRLRNAASVGSIAVVRRTGKNGGDFPCGNGDVDEGEGCDDGNTAAGDGCRPNCTVEACGDGIRDPHEDCDDGNTTSGDCCSSSCTTEPDDGACDDANACTVGDHCSAGACVAGTAVTCTATDQCDRAACDPAQGVCTHTRAAEGSQCDDGNICTILDQCISDVCTGSGALTCRDSDPCTTDVCVPTSGCAFQTVTGFPALTCLFDRPTIDTGCPGGLPRSIEGKINSARRLAGTAGATDRAAKIRRSLNGARKALRQATRTAELLRRRGKLDETCAGALATSLNDMLTTTESLRSTPPAP